jgi:hypothetical protein
MFNDEYKSRRLSVVLKQFYPVSCHFFLLKSKPSPRHSSLENPQFKIWMRNPEGSEGLFHRICSSTSYRLARNISRTYNIIFPFFTLFILMNKSKFSWNVTAFVKEYSNQEQWGGRGMQHVCGRGDMYTVFSWGNMRERDHLEVEVDDQIMLKYLFKKSVGKCGMY